jgi:hypothetical protein
MYKNTYGRAYDDEDRDFTSIKPKVGARGFELRVGTVADVVAI